MSFIMLTKGNYQVEQMQGLTDEQYREQKKGIILLQMRRYLRFLCLAGFVVTFIILIADGQMGIVSAFFSSLLICALAYGLFVFFFIYIAANRAIKITLYLKSLFGGEARL
jgi:hypothetical protein